MILAIGLVDGRHEARMLELDRTISDTKAGFLIAKTYENGSLEWRVDGGRGEVGGNGESSCALAPAVLCVQCYEKLMTRGAAEKNSQSNLVRIAAELGNVSPNPGQEELL